MSYVIAIDQGTHSTRAAILDNKGEIVACESASLDSIIIGIDRVEQDAVKLTTSLDEIISNLLANTPKVITKSIECCGIATQRSSVLCWKPSGLEASPIISWQDTRGLNDIEALKDQALNVKRLSGLPLSAHYGASKLAWLLSRNHHEQFRFGPVSSYLLNCISDSDVHLVDHANAQRMQLMDINNLNWSNELCDMFNIPICLLPELCPISSNYGCIRETEIPITAINGDQNAAWYASSIPDADTAFINIGSGAFILTSCEADKEHPYLLKTIASSKNDQIDFLLEATVNGAGNAISWLSKNKKMENPWNHLDEALSQIKNPPIFMNSVGGIGSPWWRNDIEPHFVSGSGDMSNAGMLSGVCESIIFLIVYNLNVIKSLKTVKTLHVSGGLSRSDQLCQRLANLSKQHVKRLHQHEATLKGISWIASERHENWIEAEYDVFRPETDMTLEGRWHRFSDYLGTLLGECENGR